MQCTCTHTNNNENSFPDAMKKIKRVGGVGGGVEKETNVYSNRSSIIKPATSANTLRKQHHNLLAHH